MRSLSAFTLAAVLTLTAAIASSAQTVVTPSSVMKVEAGVVYSRGDYGLTQDTTVLAVPVSYVYEAEMWTWRITVPWISIDGPASIIGDAGAGGPLRPTDGSESGLGDSSIGLTYKAVSGADKVNISFTGRVKFPTGDEDKGLGTGEVDYYAQMDLFRTYGSVTPFGTIGYRWLGDGLYQLENGWYASGGLLFTVAPGTSVGISYEWRDAIVVGGENAQEASLSVFHRFSDHLNGNLALTKGFSDASADIGIATQLSYTF
jgi:hypothetical protein